MATCIQDQYKYYTYFYIGVGFVQIRKLHKSSKGHVCEDNKLRVSAGVLRRDGQNLALHTSSEYIEYTENTEYTENAECTENTEYSEYAEYSVYAEYSEYAEYTEYSEYVDMDSIFAHTDLTYEHKSKHVHTNVFYTLVNSSSGEQ